MIVIAHFVYYLVFLAIVLSLHEITPMHLNTDLDVGQSETVSLLISKNLLAY